jgi:putative ABC transport system permease protein
VSIQQDVRFALRSWRRTPGLIAVASLSLAVGIGATTSMFSVVNAVSQYELAFEDPERLVVLWHSNPERGFQRQVPSYETMLPLLEQSQSFQGIGFFQAGSAPVTLAGVGPATRVPNQPIDVNILSVLGVHPLLGRGYRPDDLASVIKLKEVQPIVISYDTWQRRLDGDPDIIGKAVRVDAATRTVIGVMPQGFTIVPWVEEVAFWAANDLSRVPEARWMIAIGRLKPGVTIEQARAEATAVTRRVLEARGDENPSAWSARIDTLHEAYFGEVQSGLTFLLGAVSFVLLIACANVANLLLVSGAARQKELALRASLGARRSRLLRQLLTESVMLALLGGLLGIVFAFWGNRVFAALVPEDLPDFLRDISIDLRVLAFVLVVSIATGLFFGLLPALRASKVDLNETLKEGGRGSLASQGRGRAALLVAEVALSMILLVGAGLMMRGFLKEQSALPGFNTEKLLTADILLGGTKYFEKIPGDKNRVTPECSLFFERVLEGVRALPGVRSASIISRLPLDRWAHPFTIVGRPLPEPGHEPSADFNEAEAELMKTLEIPLLKGRHIEAGDVESGPWVAVINKTFAERHFPDEDPIGQAIHVTFGGGGSGIRMPEPQPREIVGVVANVEYPSFFEQEPAALFVPYRQHPEEYSGGDQWMHIRKTLLVRTSVNPLSVVSQVEKVIEGVDSNQAAHGFMTMEQRVGSSPSVTQGRFLAQLFAIFGGLAITLALVGVYGVMSYSVGQRTGEFGVRMALGARGTDLVVMLLRQSLKTILIGVALGVAGGLALSSLLNSVFWRLTTLDPVAFGGVTALMVGAALLSAYGAVHGVTRIDPQQALRYE